MSQASGGGRIAARIDRLPLTRAQWRLALISQLFWGVIIAADGVPAKLYPFTWGPRHAFGLGAFSVLLAVQFGIGILVGEYLIGIASDRWGRRSALLISSLAIALLLWPTALTDNFGLLLLFFGLSAIGMGGVLSTNVVYMGEIVPPRERGRVMLASQILAIVVFGLLGNLPAIFWVPGHYQWFIYLFSVITFFVLVPLALWGMPELPRWLEAHGRHTEAEHVMARLEGECRRHSGLNELPQPEYGKYAVPVNKHVPVRELLRGRYGRRTIILLIAWILGYSGMVYGFAGYEPEILKGFGLSSGQTFSVILISTVLGGGIALAISSVLGETFERRAGDPRRRPDQRCRAVALYFVHTVVAAYVLDIDLLGGRDGVAIQHVQLHRRQLPDPVAGDRDRPDRRGRASGRGVRPDPGRSSVRGHRGAWVLWLVRLHHRSRRPDPGGSRRLARDRPALGHP